MYAENDGTDGQEKIGQTGVSLHFGPSLLISKKVLVKCEHVKKWNKNSWVSFV